MRSAIRVRSIHVRVASAALLSSCLTALPLHAQTGRIEGKVTSAVTNAPIANAEVYITALDLSATTGADGAFALTDVPVGTYEVLVRALGFQSTVLADQEVTGAAVTAVEVQLEPWGKRAEVPTSGAAATGPRSPRVGVGLALGYDGLGRTEGAIGSSAMFQAFADYGVTSAVVLRAGVFLSTRRVEPVDYPYNLFGVYVEPRYVVWAGAPRWAPFVAGQLGLERESVARSSMSLWAVGATLAGGGGVQFRVRPQFRAEIGALVGYAWFGSYTFRGEQAWYTCLNGLEPGATLPTSVQDCAGSRGIGAELCYPPFYPENRISGDCRPPDVPYDDTGRSGTWFRVWFGVHFSLTGGGGGR